MLFHKGRKKIGIAVALAVAAAGSIYFQTLNFVMCLNLLLGKAGVTTYGINR